MKKTRILALVIAVLSLVTLLFLVSCDKSPASSSGNCQETGNHKWTDWKSNSDATCTEDGTKYRRCPVCKEQETAPDEGTATGHYFLTYVRNDDATCTEDGTETAKCFICETATDTRPAVDSALGHRYGNTPIAEESFNGYNVFPCLRGCGHKETMDNGAIDEDFEHVADGVIADNSKRYFTPNAVTELTDYTEGGKYLMLKRSADKIIGNTAFGAFFTPDYDIYKSKDYVFSYDILITENTRDLILLEGKKVATKQVFATYDSETGKIMVNGVAAYTVTPGEWINIAYVLDDVNGEFDVYVNNSLVISKAVYDKKDFYYLAADLEYLGMYMVAEPKVASEFGIDNVKTYSGKTVANPGEPMVKENITAPVSVPTNIMGTINMEWIEEFRENAKASLGGSYSDEKFNKSFAYESIEKDGEMVDVITWQNYNSGIPYYNIYEFEGLETYTLSAANNVAGTNFDFTNGKTYQVYDISGYESVTINFYCDMTSEELEALGRAGYQMLIAFYTPNAWRSDKNAYYATYTQQYYTFCAEDVLNGEDGWQSVTIPLSKFNQNHIKSVAHFTITGKGWGSDGVGIGTKENNNNNAVDGTVIKIQNITLNKSADVTYAKPAEDCEHDFSTSRTIAPTCLTSGFDVKICSKCGGEQPDVTRFVPATGHNYVTIQDIPAKCEENGYYSEKCEYCNDKVRVERVATGHTESTAEGYEPEVIAPTCYSTGITVRTCGACGVKYETDPTEMLEHTWNEGEVTTEPTCTEKGVRTYTCIHNGENGCDGTKTEDVEALGHTADEAQNGAYVPATCEKGGYTPSVCGACGVALEIENKDDKKLGHEWVLDEESEHTIAVTCYADGANFFGCARCDKTKTELVTERPAHSIDYEGEFVTITAATCSTKGEGGYKCANCDYVETDEIDMIPHTEDTTFEAIVTAPVCGVDGYTTKKCSVCAQEYKTDIVEAEEHSDGGAEHIIQIADCVNDGWEKYTCVKCGVEVTVGEVIPSKGGHKYETVIDDELKKLVKHCTVCDEKVSATVDKLPTYTELLEALGGGGSNTVYIYMNMTNKTVGSTGEMYGHSSDAKKIQFCSRLSVATVCDNEGKDGIDKYINWTKRSTADNDKTSTHSYINLFPAAPVGGRTTMEFSVRLKNPGTDGKYQSDNFQLIDRNCTAIAAGGSQFVAFAGLTETGAMTFNGAKTTIQFTEDKFTHVALDMDVATNSMNIYVDGKLVEQGKIFNDTDAGKFDMAKFQIDEVRMFNHADNNNNGLGSSMDFANIILYDGAVHAITGIDYCGLKGAEHNYVAGEPVAPDCFNDGYTPYTCEFCGDVQNRDTVAKLEHVEAEIGEEYAPKVTAPTCFAGGYTEKLCKTCGQWYVDDEVPALEHVMSAEPTADSVAPTCTEAGYNVFVCTNDGCTHSTKVDVEATGHSAESTVSKVVAPTCTAEGYNIMSCPDCGKNYKDNVVPANGHAFGEFERVAEPTCTEKGKETRKCQNCIWTESKDVAALGHAWGDPVADHELTFAATCYADGSNFYICSVCEETKVEAITERPTHEWGEYEVETPATCTEVGKEVRTCTVDGCGATSDRTITKLGHQLDEGVVTTAPTCTEDGIRTKSCTRDGCEYTEEVAEPKLGHNMVLDPENNTYNCTTDGVEALKCDREGCTYTETTEKIATGHKFQPDEGESQWTIVNPATCYAEGLRTRPCLNAGCTETESQIIRKIDHNVDKSNLFTVEATTESEGYTYYKCVNDGCDHIEKVDIIPAITTGTQGFEFDERGDGYYITNYTGEDKEIVIPATYRGKPVIGIDPSIFADDACEITGVTIESADIFTNGDCDVFNNCNLEYIVIKAGIEVPEGWFGSWVTVETIYLEDGASIGDIDWAFDYNEVVEGPKED